MRRIASHLVPFVVMAAACTPTTKPSLSPVEPVSREAVLLTAHDLAPGRRCRIVDPDQSLPDVATVLDTAAMPEYLRQIGVSADSGYALYSLRFDPAGMPARVRLIEATIGDSLAAPIEAAISSALLPRSTPLAARLRIDLGPAPIYRLGRSEYCAPERLVENNAPNANGVAVTMGPTGRKSVTEYKYDVEVSAAGKVEDVRFLTDIDVQLAEDFRVELKKQRWRPALDDGMPVPGHAITSLFLETRSRAMMTP